MLVSFRQNEGQGRIDEAMEMEHQRYMDTKHHCEDIEKKVVLELEVMCINPGSHLQGPDKITSKSTNNCNPLTISILQK